MLTKEDKTLIKKCLGIRKYGVKRLIKEFPNKEWSVVLTTFRSDCEQWGPLNEHPVVVNFTTVACIISSRLKWYKNYKNRSRVVKVIVKINCHFFKWFTVYNCGHRQSPKSLRYCLHPTYEIYTVSQKNVLTMACHNFDAHEQIFVGRNVTDKVGNQKMLWCATSNNFCFCTTWQK